MTSGPESSAQVSRVGGGSIPDVAPIPELPVVTLHMHVTGNHKIVPHLANQMDAQLTHPQNAIGPSTSSNRRESVMENLSE